MKKFLIPFVFAIFSGAAMAQSASPSFDEVDSNADGDVSEAELQAAGTDVDMMSADTDGSGTLSQDEYESATSGGSAGSDSAGSSSDYGTQEEYTTP